MAAVDICIFTTLLGVQISISITSQKLLCTDAMKTFSNRYNTTEKHRELL